MSSSILKDLYEIAQERKDADPEGSYIAQLHKKGVKKIAKKLGEESTEVVIDALRYDQKGSRKRRENLISEYSDLMFHMVVLMAHQDIDPEEVFAVLEERFGTSGLAGKGRQAETR